MIASGAGVTRLSCFPTGLHRQNAVPRQNKNSPQRLLLDLLITYLKAIGARKPLLYVEQRLWHWQ